MGNRVPEIQSLINPSQWHHVPGKHNPADLLARGLRASDRVESDVWLDGPSFLHGDEEFDGEPAISFLMSNSEMMKWFRRRGQELRFQVQHC